jgi:cysteine synthase B
MRPHNFSGKPINDEYNYPMTYSSIDQLIGNTPQACLQRITAGKNNTLLVKLEGQNPAGSVKDRPALSMIKYAQERGVIKPGDRLIEATSGNTGIALAMVAAILGYRLTLIMPETMSMERRASMAAYGAELILVSAEEGMEGARDVALQMSKVGKGRVLDQFANPDNPRAHYETTGPEIWRDTQGTVTHIVSSMGTTGTIMGLSRYLKEQSETVRIVGVHPADGASIPGIRRWPEAYLPEIYQAERVDEILDVGQQEAETMMHRLAKEEGVFCGVSSGGAMAAAVRLADTLENATIVTIICDRGDRYISTGVFPA